MIEARESFVKYAMNEFGESGCTKISPFLSSNNYAELKDRLDDFSHGIVNAIELVKAGGGLLSELPEERDELRREESASLAKFMLLTTLRPAHTTNQEKTLMGVFVREVGIAGESLRALESKIRAERKIPKDQLIETVKTLVGLDHFVLAIPTIYEGIPAEQQVAQDFLFRSHDLH